MISVLLVDDHAVVRLGLAALIDMQSDMRVVGQAGDGATAIRLYAQLQPDVVTMDMKLPDMSGSQAMIAIRRAAPSARILVLSTLAGDEHIYRAMQAGALGYLLKAAGGDELAAAIRATHANRRTIPAEIAAALAERQRFDPLTARELDLLRLVAKGFSNAEIAAELGLSENTVKGYLKSINSKLDAPDRAAAAIIAVQRGLIDVEKV
jgi:DNA-binding NarL/FixJ family response regulator